MFKHKKRLFIIILIITAIFFGACSKQGSSSDTNTDIGSEYSESGTYTLSGNITGPVVVSGEKVTLILDGANIHRASGPAILGEAADPASQEITIELVNNNTLESEDDGAINAKGSLIITGNGRLTTNSPDKGIHSDYTLTIQSGTLFVTTDDEGIEASEIIIEDGDITVVAGEDGINASTDFDDITPSFTMNGGFLRLYSQSDGLDSNGYLNITGGSALIFINAPTDGDPLDSDLPATITPGFSQSGNFKKGDTLAISNAIEDVLLTETLLTDATSYVIILPFFLEGETYTVLINDTFQEVTVSSQLQNQSPGGGPGNNGGFPGPNNQDPNNQGQIPENQGQFPDPNQQGQNPPNFPAPEQEGEE